MKIILFLLCTLLCMRNSSQYSSGAPLEACNMTPGHSFQPQQGSAEIEIIIPSIIISNSVIPIIIRSTSENFSFRGFEIQARKTNGDLIGKFISSDSVGVMNCYDIESSSATHKSSALKSEILIEWQAPSVETTLSFNIFITIVKSADTFWVNQQFGLYSIEPENNQIQAIYDGCAVNKICFGIPDRCVDEGNCESFVAVTYENDKFIFELLSTTNQRYVASATSKTPTMTDASNIECVQENNGDILAYASLSLGRSVQRAVVNQNTIELIESRLIDGRIYCKVRKDAFTTINEFTFDLKNEEFYLLLASGTNIIPNAGITRHDTNRGASNGRILLTKPRNVGVDTSISTLLLIHGSFMIVAWIGLTSIGIVIARYFKTTWQNKKIGGKDIWFVWHITCMCLTFLLTLSGFIVIFIDIGGWHTTPHAVLGCIVFTLSCTQAIGAVFRPDPKAPARPLFNWLHRAFGNIAHLFAAVTIFFAIGLPRSSLPAYTYYILAAFIGFYLLMHIIFKSIDILGEIKKDLKVTKETPHRLLQKTLFGFFFIVILLFVIGLVLIFTLDLSE